MKNVVIVGASTGIGKAIALKLGAKGFSIALGARRERELQSVADEAGGRAISVVMDATVRKDVERLSQRAIEAFGGIDVWINSTGRGILRKVMDITDADLDEMVQINIKTALYGMQTIIPHFQQRKKGHLINLSSFLARYPVFSERSAYSAAKAALNSLSTNLRMDLATEYPQIHISDVMPNVVTTEFAYNSLHSKGPATPLKQVIQPQTAEQVADLIAELIDRPQQELFTNPMALQAARMAFGNVPEFEVGLKKA